MSCRVGHAIPPPVARTRTQACMTEKLSVSRPSRNADQPCRRATPTRPLWGVTPVRTETAPGRAAESGRSTPEGNPKATQARLPMVTGAAPLAERAGDGTALGSPGKWEDRAPCTPSLALAHHRGRQRAPRHEPERAQHPEGRTPNGPGRGGSGPGPARGLPSLGAAWIQGEGIARAGGASVLGHGHPGVRRGPYGFAEPRQEIPRRNPTGAGTTESAPTLPRRGRHHAHGSRWGANRRAVAGSVREGIPVQLGLVNGHGRADLAPRTRQGFRPAGSTCLAWSNPLLRVGGPNPLLSEPSVLSPPGAADRRPAEQVCATGVDALFSTRPSRASPQVRPEERWQSPRGCPVVPRLRPSWPLSHARSVPRGDSPTVRLIRPTRQRTGTYPATPAPRSSPPPQAGHEQPRRRGADGESASSHTRRVHPRPFIACDTYRDAGSHTPPGASPP